MLPRKLLPCSSVMGMLKSSVFFYGPLRGYKADDKTDVCLLPQSHQKVISLLHPIPSDLFVTVSSFIVLYLVSHVLQEKENK